MTLERAELLLDAGRHAQAGELLSRMVAENADDPGAWTLLGRAHLGTGDVPAALSALDEAVRLAPHAYPVLVTHGFARAVAGRADAEESLRAATGAAPDAALPFALLSRVIRDQPGRAQEALDLANEAVRREPDLPDGHLAACLAAASLGNEQVCLQALHETLRLDPANELALTLITTIRAGSTTAGRAATLIADVLAAHPHLTDLVPQLDAASYRLLRGMRWLAVACLGVAGLALDLFLDEGEVGAPLPIDTPDRLWAVTLMALIWGLGAVIRWRRLRAGARLHVRTLLRRGRWSRVVAAQTVLLMLAALVIVLPPWPERGVPQTVLLIGLVPTLATIVFDRKRRP